MAQQNFTGSVRARADPVSVKPESECVGHCLLVALRTAILRVALAARSPIRSGEPGCALHRENPFGR